MHDVSGVSGAAPIWREVMDWLHRGDPQRGREKFGSAAPKAPPGIVNLPIRFEPAQEPPRQEWFAGTESGVIRTAIASALARIAYPTAGSIIALDPDIPPQRQRVPLRLSAPAESGAVWRMDQLPLGKADGKLLWLPQPGKHRLTLANSRGEEIDSISFEVRAMKGRAR
jgi:penicillin-binding protein 1C